MDTGASADSGDFTKLRYLFAAIKVRKLVGEIEPDIINVHFATSYGTVAALARLRNYVLSMWGADIYDFPKKSFIHAMMLRYSLGKAPYLFSTSRAMADEARRYTGKPIEITPFGVDMTLFNPDKRKRSEDGKFIIGTVKTLTPKYGIDYLLKAVAIVKKKRPDVSLEVRIAGKGPMEGELRALSSSLGLESFVVWLGYVSQAEAAREWANMDIGIVYSTLESESFGVSAVEAEASACPLIISDIPGLMEATDPGVSSLVVPRCSEEKLASAIISLFDRGEERILMGRMGREFVSEKFELDRCFSDIENLFRKILESSEQYRSLL